MSETRQQKLSREKNEDESKFEFSREIKDINIEFFTRMSLVNSTYDKPLVVGATADQHKLLLALSNKWRHVIFATRYIRGSESIFAESEPQSFPIEGTYYELSQAVREARSALERIEERWPPFSTLVAFIDGFRASQEVAHEEIRSLKDKIERREYMSMYAQAFRPFYGGR